MVDDRWWSVMRSVTRYHPLFSILACEPRHLYTKDSMVGVDVNGFPLECQHWADRELRGLLTNPDICFLVMCRFGYVGDGAMWNSFASRCRAQNKFSNQFLVTFVRVLIRHWFDQSYRTHLHTGWSRETMGWPGSAQLVQSHLQLR